ncbi:hypothetical protein [Flavobacterium sp. NKUCC04_CG]|uniref:hypothetical protein n=1 Tax=Flavobacterium sp. NKUCC04_CG TaxID=2842121 RepID=UPI001C5AA132|nr:hypothetical protein [Flavobacterium sp. NKUCC04_CG]MBW3518058.1 hypothetical protein [Flavobacterium sp. NKUCC04_CG]
MTSIDFIIKTYELLNSQDYRITFSPAKNKNWMLLCNNHFIGGLFDEALYFVYTEAASQLLDNPPAVYKGYSTQAQHKMLLIPLEKAMDLLVVTYKEKFDWANFVCDISSHFTANRKYPEHIINTYEMFVVFLRFCYEKELLVLNPLDKNNRILYMNYKNQDLTDSGKLVFTDLMIDWFTYTDRTNKIDNTKMLEKYYLKILQKNQILD